MHCDVVFSCVLQDVFHFSGHCSASAKCSMQYVWCVLTAVGEVCFSRVLFICVSLQYQMEVCLSRVRGQLSRRCMKLQAAAPGCHLGTPPSTRPENISQIQIQTQIQNQIQNTRIKQLLIKFDTSHLSIQSNIPEKCQKTRYPLLLVGDVLNT